MKKAKKLLLLTLWLVFSISYTADSQTRSNLDFSGFEQFLRIGSVLEQDREPAPEEWDRLFETPGYEILTRSEFSRDFFKNNFRLVGMPSKSRELTKALEEEAKRPPHQQFLSHYLKAKQNSEELRLFIDSIQTHSGKLITDAAQRAMEFLPPLKRGENEFIPVSFLVFTNDARGYTPVVIDVLFAQDLGKNLPVLIAHELHHYYRNMNLNFDMDLAEKEQQDLLWVMNQVQAEGIADQIDKRILMDKEGPMHAFAERWEALVEQAPGYLSNFDKLLAATQSPQDMEEVGKKLKNSLPMSGHPIGFYMANIILEQEGKMAMIDNVGNPFAFFRQYHQAAQSSGNNAPHFSDKTLEVIRHLEGKYAGK